MLFNFWRKPKLTFSDPQLGTLQYAHDLWSRSIFVNGEEILINVAGTESAPNLACLTQVKSALGRLPEIISAAEAMLNSQDRGEWSDPTNGKLEFNGISSSEHPEMFRLHFGLSNWPDASIAVCFRDTRPVEVELGD